MLKASRIAGLLTMLLGLSGCNLVVSEEPWFTEADSVGVPAFRHGLWLTVSEPNCLVDETLPAEQWPDCAGASYHREGEWLSMEWEQTGKGKRARRKFVGWNSGSGLVAHGSPLIVQIEAPEGSGEEAEPDEPVWRYWYAAVRPTRHDEKGRVVAVAHWAIRCGPVPSPASFGVDHVHIPADEEMPLSSGYVTDQPFPGLTVMGDNCIAEGADALRQAARLSESLSEHGVSRWVRDGWR